MWPDVVSLAGLLESGGDPAAELDGLLWQMAPHMPRHPWGAAGMLAELVLLDAFENPASDASVDVGAGCALPALLRTLFQWNAEARADPAVRAGLLYTLPAPVRAWVLEQM